MERTVKISVPLLSLYFLSLSGLMSASPMSASLVHAQESAATKDAQPSAEVATENGLIETSEEPPVVQAVEESGEAASKKPEGENDFIRLVEKDGQPSSLDTAWVRFGTSSPEGVTVDLIGAVHIGEASYYAQLNEMFDEYDVLLYELVAPEGVELPKGGPERTGFNPVAMMQDGAKQMLGLELQLEKIDYTKAHFVRADMTPQQIADKMAERGDTAFTLALDTFADVMRQQNLAMRNPAALEEQLDFTLADMFGNPLKMKRVLATQFAATGSIDQALGGALNQLLIIDRNAAALKELQKQIAHGKKKIGIFYGAAHLPDFEKRLKEDFGLERQETKWVAAWDLSRGKTPSLAEPMELLLNVLEAIE